MTTEEEALAFMNKCATTFGLGTVSPSTVARISDVKELYVRQLDPKLCLESIPIAYPMMIMLNIAVPGGIVKVCVAGNEDNYDVVCKLISEYRENIGIDTKKA